MRWEIDPVHSTVGFSVKHMMVSTVRGRFGRVKGTLELDPERPDRATADVAIDVTSVDTGMAGRDDHLRSPDFFAAEAFPTATFRSTRVEALGGARYRVVGDLTIRDITRPVTLEAEVAGTYRDPRSGTRIGIDLSGTIDRTAFGLRWNQALEAGGVLVSDDVKLNLEIAAVARAEERAA